jgi:hypothetical protein
MSDKIPMQAVSVDPASVLNQFGETLRDRFALAALTGMMARDTYDEGQATPEQRAKLSYIEADAMLAARGKK